MDNNNVQNPMMGNNFQNPIMDNNNVQNPMMGNNFQNPMMDNNNAQNPMMGNNFQNPMMNNNNGQNPMMGNNMQNPMMGNDVQNQIQMMNNIAQAAMIMNTLNQMNNMNNMMQNAEMLKQSMNNANMQMNANPQSFISPNDSLLVTFQAKNEKDFSTVSITVQCLAGDKVSKLIENYRIKSQDYDTTKKFIFNAKNLVPSLTCAESGLTNNCIVYVIATKHIKGA